MATIFLFLLHTSLRNLYLFIFSYPFLSLTGQAGKSYSVREMLVKRRQKGGETVQSGALLINEGIAMSFFVSMQRASQDQTYDKVNMGIHFGHFESSL